MQTRGPGEVGQIGRIGGAGSRSPAGTTVAFALDRHRIGFFLSLRHHFFIGIGGQKFVAECRRIGLVIPRQKNFAPHIPFGLFQKHFLLPILIQKQTMPAFFRLSESRSLGSLQSRIVGGAERGVALFLTGNFCKKYRCLKILRLPATVRESHFLFNGIKLIIMAFFGYRQNVITAFPDIRKRKESFLVGGGNIGGPRKGGIVGRVLRIEQNRRLLDGFVVEGIEHDTRKESAVYGLSRRKDIGEIAQGRRLVQIAHGILEIDGIGFFLCQRIFDKHRHRLEVGTVGDFFQRWGNDDFVGVLQHHEFIEGEGDFIVGETDGALRGFGFQEHGGCHILGASRGCGAVVGARNGQARHRHKQHRPASEKHPSLFLHLFRNVKTLPAFSTSGPPFCKPRNRNAMRIYGLPNAKTNRP